jgi:hypothetical protein
MSIRVTVAASATLLASIAWISAPAGAAGTDPTLALTSAEAVAVAGNTMVRLHGSVQFDDLLQFSFPAGVILFQGSNFVRVPMSGAAVSGTASLLAGGLADTELFTLLGLGGPAPAPAQLISLQPSEVRIALPAGFSSGAATAVVYAVLEGDPFLSNAIEVTLP